MDARSFKSAAGPPDWASWRRIGLRLSARPPLPIQRTVLIGSPFRTAGQEPGPKRCRSCPAVAVSGRPATAWRRPRVRSG